MVSRKQVIHKSQWYVITIGDKFHEVQHDFDGEGSHRLRYEKTSGDWVELSQIAMLNTRGVAFRANAGLTVQLPTVFAIIAGEEI